MELVSKRSIKHDVDAVVDKGYCPHSFIVGGETWSEARCYAAGERYGMRSASYLNISTEDVNKSRCTVEDWKNCPLLKRF